MQRLEAGFALLVAALGAVFAVIIAFIALSVTGDNLMRNFGLGNIPWLNEVIEYLLYTGTFLAAPWALRLGAHVRVDILVSSLPRAAAQRLEIVLDILGLIISGMLFYYGVVAVYDSWVAEAKQYKMLTVSEWLLLVPFAVACLLIAIEFIFRILRARRIVPLEESVLEKSGF
jgi:TRAP-type transport system small permease protein